MRNRPVSLQRGAVLLVCGLVGACSSRIDGPKPELAGASPPAVCNEQLVTQVVISGADLSPLPIGTLTDDPTLELPEVSLHQVQDLLAQAVDGPTFDLPDVGADSYVIWQSRQSLLIRVDPALGLAQGLYDLTVANPNGKKTTLPDALLAVPPPVLDEIVPDLVCAEQDNAMTLNGSYFIRFGALLPQISFGDSLTLDATDATACQALPGPAGAEMCDTLTVDVDADALDTAGAAYANFAVAVTNPESVQCESGESILLTAVPRPMLTSVTPVPVCLDQGAVQVGIDGAGFLAVDALTPTLTLGAVTGIATTVVDASCQVVSGPAAAVRACTQLTATLAQGSVPAGLHAASITNPAPADCISTDPISFRVVPPPTITTPNSGAQAALCQGGGSLTITGANLRLGATVRINGVAASSATPGTSSCDADGLCTELEVEFGFLPGALVTAPSIDLEVTNVEGCSAISTNSVDVIPGPMVIYVDPPYVYDDFANELTVYGTNFGSGAITHVELMEQVTGEVVVLCDVSGTPVACDALTGSEGSFTANLPAHTLATIDGAPSSATFAIRVTDASDACGSQLPNAVTVVSEVTPSTLVLSPGFGRVGTEIPITITMSEPATPNGLLLATPRAYLTTATSGGPLKSVAFVSANVLTALVPSTFTIGATYEDFDLTIVNPEGTVFAKPAAFRLSSFPPPRVDTLNPGQVSPTGGAVQVVGVDFEDEPIVSLSYCHLPAAPGTYPHDTDGDGVNDGYIIAEGSVTWVDASHLTFTAPTSIQDTVCLVRVENPRDNAFDLFSALVYANASGNIPPPQASSIGMLVPRQGHGAAAVPATRAAHFLYAVAGDNVDDGTLGSVEYAPLLLGGDLGGAFRAARYSLNTPRTRFSLLQAGRALYAAGGADNTGTAIASVERAVVLDPTEVVRPGLDAFEFGDPGSPGLAAGGFIYRVAIVFADTDPENPCGEALPSEPFVMNLPDVENGLKLTLSWSQANAANLGSTFAGRVVAGYRLYRTPEADMALGDLEFLNNVSGAATLTYLDDGQPVGVPASIGGCPVEAWTATRPLAFGETSRWVTLSGGMQLGQARQAAGFASVPDLTPGSTMNFLYVMSGVDAAGAGLTDYELLILDADPTAPPSGWEAAAGWTRVTDALPTGSGSCSGSTARRFAGLFVANKNNSSQNGANPEITDFSQYLGLGPGRAPAGTGRVNMFQTWEIDLTTGLLSGYFANCDGSNDFAGYGNVCVNRQFFYFGGTNSSSTLLARMPEIEWYVDETDSDRLKLQNMNFTGDAEMTIPRFGHAVVVDRAYIFVLGGETTAGVTNAVEFSVW